MHKKKPRSWSTLIIQGTSLKPDTVSRELGVSPDYSHDSNTTSLQDKQTMPIWQLNSRLKPDATLSEHLWDILERIAPARKLLKEWSQEMEIVLYTSVEFSDADVDGIKLEPRLMLLLGDLGIHLEFLPWLEESA
ncbi:DUF4279 domain-containing protein [Leptospira sp. GIMC2001]|uniref:DUF4279 domain-containing protein n=1 Tax=Leptospira sp. GIMC2001 TaxID=1513297 RepID=UPI00234933CD|nr:DUF4279 domain-containing protein [Leptospira sp. GIMC2001]WCL47802.1 DUF4279 domain-containing protein [Leptospira sp. GIMC2001]